MTYKVPSPSTKRMPPGAVPAEGKMQHDVTKENLIKVNVVVKNVFVCAELQHAMIFSQR